MRLNLLIICFGFRESVFFLKNLVDQKSSLSVWPKQIISDHNWWLIKMGRYWCYDFGNIKSLQCSSAQFHLKNTFDIVKQNHPPKPVLSVRRGSSSLIRRWFPSLLWKRNKCHIFLLCCLTSFKKPKRSAVV